MRLDNSKGPLYRVLQATLQRDILSGARKPGDWLPSESQLSKTYGVSQTSVRRALLELERLGLIERHQGRGSAVASNEIRAVSPMLGLGTELRQSGYEIGPELLDSFDEPASAEIAQRLGVDEGTTLRRIQRRYWFEDEPLVYLDHHLTLGAGLDYGEFGGDSLYAFLATRDALPANARERVTALNVVGREAELLGVPDGTAALLRERTAYGAGRRPVEYTRYVMRSDRYHLEIDLRKQP